MKKSVYYRTLYRRDNPIKEFVASVLYDLCSIPRMILEVMIRRSFGKRYFSFTLAMIVLMVLIAIPAFIAYGPWNYYTPAFGEFILKNLSWYAFLLVYLISCLRRRREKTLAAGEFDFDFFTRASGDILPGFTRLRPFGRPATLREIETIIEPLFFAAIGLVLIALGQAIGILIVFCAVGYSISYLGAYWRGDDILMDIIDERIVNEGMFEIFVDGDEHSTHKGFRYRGPRPPDREFRKNLADDMSGDDDDDAAAAI
ncbi:hypothetical protein ACWKW6_31905 [Dyadobacter jiangsuensis]